MTGNKRIILFVVSLILLILPVTSAMADEKSSVITETVIGWELTKARVVSSGYTANLPEGILVSGYQVEAEANAIGDGFFKKGKFQITASIFSPHQDMPGQQAGQWYVQGAWSISDKNLARAEKKFRHNTGTIKGKLSAQLSFNPAAGSGSVNALVTIPMSLAGGIWTDADGTFVGNEKFQGTISMNADKWPDLSKTYGR